jgi:hypothetical protein
LGGSLPRSAVDALDEQLDDPRLLGREQLAPDLGELGEGTQVAPAPTGGAAAARIW